MPPIHLNGEEHRRLDASLQRSPKLSMRVQRDGAPKPGVQHLSPALQLLAVRQTSPTFPFGSG